MRMCRSADAAEDLVHDTFERVLRSPRRIRGDELGYLIGAMRNTHIDGVRAAVAALTRPSACARPANRPTCAARTTR